MTNISRAIVVTALCLILVTPAYTQQVIQPRSGEPLPGLTAAERLRFDLGKAAFEHVQTLAEGLGPIFNRNRCFHCHSGPTTRASRLGGYHLSSNGGYPGRVGQENRQSPSGAP